MGWTVESPDGEVEIRLEVVDGVACYTVLHGGVTVIELSRLGITTTAGEYGGDLEVEDAGEPERIVDEFELPHGKRRTSTATAHQRTIRLGSPSGTLTIVLRAYDDGVAFRYGIDAEDETRVTGEPTEFKVAGEGRAFLQPHQYPTQYAPAYELPYGEVPLGHSAQVAGWVFPSLFHTADRWLLVTEADVDETYHASHLSADTTDGVYRIAAPDRGEGLGLGEVEPTISGSWSSPWRALIVGRQASTVFESDLVRHLTRPAEIDHGWVRPGRVSWSWWSDHESPQNPDAIRNHIAVAAELGWEYSLIDANWNLMPDGTIEELVDYASDLGVGLCLWYNSGGPHNDVTEQPRDRMHDRARRRAEFEWLASAGIKGVKVDFFHRDKQDGIALYLDILRDAADFEIMVNFHGSTIPRGWDRRFPHLMTMEGVWGAEQYGFDASFSETAPSHNTILPLTRNVPGSMDYTPVTFTDTVFPHRTTNAHELALSVVFESALQHFADSAASYRSQPHEVRAFLSAVPSVWDDSRLLAGEPGDHLVIARRLGDRWFVGAISGVDEARTVTVPEEYVAEGTVVIGDSPDPRQFTIDEVGGPLEIELAPHGGFVAWDGGL